MTLLVLAVALVPFTGPDDQVIDVNPAEVVSVRVPRSSEHFAAGIHCLIHTSDGKYIAVTEDCAVVRQRLLEGDAE